MKAQTYNLEWWRPQPAQAPASAAGLPQALGRESADSPWPFRLLLLFTFILLLAPQARYPVLQPLRIAMLAGAAALVAHVFTRWSRGLPLFTLPEGSRSVLLLAGWAVLTIPLSYWPGGSIEYLTGTYAKTLVVFFLLASTVNSLQRLTVISWGLSLMAVPLALTTIKNYATGVYAEGGRVLGYMAPLTGNPNDMALMLNLILPFVIALFLDSQRAGMRMLLGGVAGLLATAVILTFSRAGFLTLAVIFCVYLWRLRRRPERFWAPLALVLALGSLPFLPSTYMERLETITDIEEDETGSAQNRMSDMTAAAGYVVRNPVVGAGLGQNVLAMNEVRGETWIQVHNVYLQYAMELGGPGLVFFLLLYRACFRHTRRAMAISDDSPQGRRLYFLSEAVWISLFAFAVEAFFHPVAYHFYFYYIAGLALALSNLTGGAPGSQEPMTENGYRHADPQESTS